MNEARTGWQDRVLLITGAGPGMGRAVAVQAASAGADVALVARTPATLEETAELVRARGREALCLPTDVSKPAAVKQAVNATFARFGRIDTLVHSILPPHLLKRVLDLQDEDLETWRQSVETSIFGALLVGRAVAHGMVIAGGGAMVFVTATSALQGYPAVSAHAAGKAGIHSLVQCMASEFGAHGIRVNAVAVGVIEPETPRQSPLDLPPDIERMVDARDGALQRNVSADEVTNTVLFLGSDASSGITGQIVAVDGGRFFH